MGAPDPLARLVSEYQRLKAMLDLDGLPEAVRAHIAHQTYAVASEIVAIAAARGDRISVRIEEEGQPVPPPEPITSPEPIAPSEPPPPGPKPRRRLTAPLRPPPREDFGEFVTAAHPEEDKMLREIAQRAIMNPRGGTVQKTLMNGTNDQNGYTIAGARTVAIDLRERTITICEVWGGLTTARRTRPLDGI